MSKKINWTNTLFLIITPIVAILGTGVLLFTTGVAWQTWTLMGVLLLFSGLGVTAGYHRLFAHKSYETVWWVRLLFLLFGSSAFEGSVLEWCTDHRNHHRYTDTKKDPYNINQGFWYAHMGWLIRLDTTSRDFSNVEDLAKDPLVRFQHRFFVPLAILMGFLLPMGLGALWGDAWAGLIVAGALRIVINQHFTFCINSVCHLFGKRTYSLKQSARDNWFTALFTFGEGFHNFHHQFPIDYRNGLRYFHYDPTKWLIRGLAYLGLAKKLKRVDAYRIARYKVQVMEERLKNEAPSTLQTIREKIELALQTLEKLEKEYRLIKAEKVKHYRVKLRAYRANMKVVQRELQDYLLQWSLVAHQV